MVYDVNMCSRTLSYSPAKVESLNSLGSDVASEGDLSSEPEPDPTLLRSAGQYDSGYCLEQGLDLATPYFYGPCDPAPCREPGQPTAPPLSRNLSSVEENPANPLQ